MSTERIRAFCFAVQRGSAERTIETRLGTALLADSVPAVYDANYLSVADRFASADEIVTEADGALESLHHRRIVLEHANDATATELGRHGYIRSTHLVCAHRRELDRRVDTSMVSEVDFERLAPYRTASTLAEPWGDPEIARQLNGAKRLVMRAVPTRFFAAVIDGAIAGHCEVRSDGATAQIEDVEVARTFRGRGLGRAIVQHALDEARAGHDLVFLEALADDWPRLLYAKLGFDVVGRRDFLTRFPHPLTRLRLRTPALELRLATVAELRQLYAVAAAGIHDPEFMPFEFAWTDRLDEAGFLAYHADKLASFAPHDWHLDLVAFLDGRPVGVQSVTATGFESERSVTTGSWLGRAFQGQGLGTEMRAAVLTLAFDGLGAATARSGAISGNAQSLGVSRKFGYAHTGVATVSPRGTPVPHDNLELRRAGFSSPVPVEIDGLESLLPLLGA